MKDLPPEQASAIGFISTETRCLFDVEDAATLFEGMVPGSAVIALAIEHRWAVTLVNALYEAVVVDEALASLTKEV